jgi:hypothetical protein
MGSWNTSARRGHKELPPVRVFGLPLRLLPFRSWDFTFDRKGNAISAWHPKASGITSYLLACEQKVFQIGSGQP